MLGKEKCQILKEIRQRIADANHIPYKVTPCNHKGNCSGTCPRCESEVRYLEGQLQKRASMGKRVTVAALCAGMAFTAAGCDLAENIRAKFEPTETPEIYWLEGEVAMPFEEDPTAKPSPTAEIPLPDIQTPEYIPDELSGYVGG